MTVVCWSVLVEVIVVHQIGTLALEFCSWSWISFQFVVFCVTRLSQVIVDPPPESVETLLTPCYVVGHVPEVEAWQ